MRTDEEHVHILPQRRRGKRLLTAMPSDSVPHDAGQGGADAGRAVEGLGEDLAVAEVVVVWTRCGQARSCVREVRKRKQAVLGIREASDYADDDGADDGGAGGGGG